MTDPDTRARQTLRRHRAFRDLLLIVMGALTAADLPLCRPSIGPTSCRPRRRPDLLAASPIGSR